MDLQRPSLPQRSEPSLVVALAVAAMGVYSLIVIGATTAVLEGATACPTWPTCHGQWLVGLDDPALVVAWTHRVATLVVGAVLVVTAVIAWRSSASRRVRLALGIAMALYPVQMGIGALAATVGASPVLTGTHLVVAMGIFSSLLVALLWQLESAVSRELAPFAPGSDGTANRWPSADETDDGKPVPPVDSSPGGGDWGWRRQIRAYFRLTKPKLWWLLCLVALSAMALAAGPTLSPALAATTLLGGVLAIAASGTFNNVIERDRDRWMERTNDRPLVDGRLPVRNAVALGLLLATTSVAVFLAFVNPLSAGLALLAIVYYSLIYTVILKPHTPKNIVIGGAVGAFPALIGWAAVENSIGLSAMALGAVIFLWTPAHFYNLALVFREDYDRAGFPMLPVVRGDDITRRHILAYLGATLLATAGLGTATRLDWVYALAAATVGGVFLWAVIRLYAERNRRAAWRAFHASNAYLGIVLLAIFVDVVIV